MLVLSSTSIVAVAVLGTNVEVAMLTARVELPLRVSIFVWLKDAPPRLIVSII
jgi:hypothetical protein